MKKYLSILGIGAAAIISGTHQAEAIPTWAESYGVDTYTSDGKLNNDPFYGSGHDYPVAMAKMPDGGFVVAGQIDLPELHLHGGSPGPTGALVRYASNGTILWQTVLRQTNDTTQPGYNIFYPAVSHINQIATDPQGNIFVCGYKGGNGYNDNTIHSFVAKFSPAGGLIWQNGMGPGSAVIGTPPQTVPLGTGATYYMSLTNDGGVVITLAQSRPNAGYTIPALVKFDANGNLAFSKAYENTIQYLGSAPVCQSKDGSRYVMAFPFETDGSALGSRYGLVLLVTDAAGNTVAQYGYNHSDNPGEQPVAIVATADGGFATLSAPYPDGSFGILRKFNSNLSAELFEKRISITPGQARGALATNSLVETADGGFLIGGMTQNQDGTGFTDVMLMKLNSAGALQFVSLLGGPKNEGYPMSWSLSSAFGIETADGGYGLGATSLSYHVGGAISDGAYEIPDWWIAKTDANRKIRGFKDTMVDQSLGTYTITGTPEVGANVSLFQAPGYPYGLSTTDQPQFIFQDLGAKAAPDRPTVIFQASVPRLVGPTRAEAVVGQHFSYPIQAAFFSDLSKVTYQAFGLPTNFTIDTKTGVISGVAKPGSETTQPIDLLIVATDGTDTADGALHLTIGDGVPFLTVNGSDQPTAGVADTVLTFVTNFPGTQAGRKVIIEKATNPNGPWSGLDSGLGGNMVFDSTTGYYVLASTNYPQQDGVYFRTRVRVDGFTPLDRFSNIVGPFALGSSKARAGKTVFALKRNGVRADFDFRVTQLSAPAGVALRVQTSKTPGVEGSWTDLPGGGAMNPDGASDQYALLQKKIMEGHGIYFRAIASGSGLVDSISNFIGSYTVEAETPPSVSLTSPGVATRENPFVISTNANGIASINIHATATAGNNRSIASLIVLLNGEPLYTVHPNAASGSIDYQRNVTDNDIAEYVIEALALDDKGATARAATGATYVRVQPGTTTAQKSAGSTSRSGSTQATTLRHVYSVANSGGNWEDPSTWRDLKNNPGVPGADDFVIIGNSTVHFTDAEQVFSLSINGGHIVGPGVLQINNLLTVYAGSFDGFVHVVIRPQAVCELLNVADFHIDGLLDNFGKLNVHGPRSLDGMQQFLNQGLVTYQLPLLPSQAVAAGLPRDIRALSAQLILDSGKSAVQSLITENGAGIVTNTSANLVGNSGGTLISNDGGSLISNDGGSLVTDNGSGIISNDGGSLVGEKGLGVISNDGNSIIGNDGASLISNDGGSLISNDGGSFKAGPGNVLNSRNAQAATAETGYIKKGGETDLTNLAIIGPVTLEAGVLSGSGVIIGDVTNNGGYITPGHSAGSIAVTGNFTQGAGGTTVIEAAGAEAGRFDQLQIGGTASLNGKLDLKLVDGYVPLANDPMNPFAANAVTGSFSSVSSNAQVTVNSTGVSATLDPNKPNPSSGQPLNIATRLAIQSGDNVLIAGFIVTGPAGSTKKVMIRGIGPSLANVGVAGVISDPLLELHKPDGSVVANDNWQDSDTSQIPAGFAPGDSHESVIVATLEPGNYSAVVKGAHGETGVGLAEVYDLESGSNGKLANIATRGFVQTGDSVLIGGFIIGGTEPAKILIRAISPSLAPFGVPNTLTATTLELHDSNGSVISNEGWRNTQESEIIATTIAPSNDNESAILATLVPGNYTAVVRGRNDTTGIAVVEAYNLQ